MYMHLELRGEGAGELTYLLDKNPDRLFEWEVNGAMVRVFFPVYHAERARAVVTYWPPPSATAFPPTGTSGKRSAPATRPFAIDSLFVSALEVAFRPALRPPGKRRDTGRRVHDLAILLCPVCTYLGTERIQSLFGPLGYEVGFRELPSADIAFANRRPRVLEIELTGRRVVEEALRHLMVLIPVMDSDRHAYMTQKDIERLTRLGAGWLDEHPERPFIVSRYLLYRRLIDTFVQRARRGGGTGATADGYDAAGEPMPQRITPETFRADELVKYLAQRHDGAERLLVVGAGDARLIGELVGGNRFTEILVVDPDQTRLDRVRRSVERTGRYSQVLNGPGTRVDYQVSALGYRDSRLEGFDLALVVEPLEHAPLDRLGRTLAPLFHQWRPRLIVLTVPNDAFRAAHPERNGHKGNPAPSRTRELVGACRSVGEAAGYGVALEDLGEAGHGPSPFLVVSFAHRGGRR